VVLRPTLLAAAGALSLLAVACGDDPGPPRQEPLVRLELTAPDDAAVVRAETIEISGTVRPARATVEVLGNEVAVEGGRFTAEVPLEPGANLIDVAASAADRRPDFAAMRVVREERVALPDVVGRDADTAKEELEALGLTVGAENAGGFLDPLLPGDPKVCDMQPDAGEQVLPGSEVMLLVARDC
jgi:hypothetical protein